jgi:ABC-type Na+ efflux pump permease subunit
MHSYFDAQGAVIALTVSLGLLFVLARAATSVTSEKDRQCWEPLLLTSLTSREILAAKLLGNIYAMRLLFVVVGLFFVLNILADPLYMHLIPLQCLTIAVITLFASALGVYCSLVFRDSMRALAAALVTGVFVGGLYLLCCASCAIGVFQSHGPPEFSLAGCIPFLIHFSIAGYQYPEKYHHGEQLAAFYLGLIGYSAATVALIAIGLRSHALRGNATPAGARSVGLLE